jgi:hypothetical protein
MRPRRTPARLFCWGAADQTRRIWHWQAFTRKGATIGRKLRICNLPETRTVRSRQTKAARYFGSGSQIGKQHGKSEVSPNSLRSCLARSLHTYLDPGSQVSEARSSFKVRRACPGAVGNQGVFVASIPDFIVGALPFYCVPDSGRACFSSVLRLIPSFFIL